MIQIEKGFQFKGKKEYNKYPYSKMEVGDSFFITSSSKSIAYSSAYQWQKRNRPDWKFGVQEDQKDGVKGFRIFRLK